VKFRVLHVLHFLRGRAVGSERATCGFPNGNKSIETFGDVPAAAIFYRFTFGISAGGLGMSSPKSVGVGSKGFASLMCLTM
jgi:hypothetical protein